MQSELQIASHDSKNRKGLAPVQVIWRMIWSGIQLLILLYALWVLGYLVSRQLISGWDNGLIEFTHSFTPWFGPIGLVMLVGALFSSWRWLLVGLLIPGLIAFVVWYSPLWLPAQTVEPPSGSRVLQVATFNILAPQSDPEQIPDAIRALEADIIGLQEIGSDHAAYIETQLGDVYPHQVLVPHQPTYTGVGLISRYPITTHEVYQPEPDSYLHMRAELDIDGTSVIVYVAHPRPADNRLNPFRYDNTWRGIEIQHTLQRVRQENGPVLLLCDCNMADQSLDYAAMDEVLDDAFREVGWGLGLTFPAYRPYIPSLIRIDYVWFNDYFVALAADTSADPGTSDHRPVQAELALIQPGQ